MSEFRSIMPELATPKGLVPGEQKQSLGRLLVQMGRLKPADIDRILSRQSSHDCSFGRAAIDLGLVSEGDIMDALARQYQYPTLQDAEQRKRLSRDLVVGHDPFGAAAEEFRAIRTTILHSHLGRDKHSMAVVGAAERAGATYFAANLAVSFAQMTLPTVLVETNMRTPRMSEMWSLPKRATGLAEVLRRREIDDMALSPTPLPNLFLLPAGAAPPNPQELLGSAEFASLHQWLEANFRAVIYDTAPASDYADARVVCGQVGSAILVARKNRTRYRQVSTLVKSLEKTGCDVIGSIFNNH